MLFDTHAHLDDQAFAADLPDVLQDATRKQVTRTLAVAVSAASSHQTVALACQHDQIDAAVGIQPNVVGDAKQGDWDQIVQLANDLAAVAIGETGLDRHWDDTPFDQQQDYFDRHLRLAQRVDLPFIV
ncbi:MAG: TatD family hydrolase, partial [Planctomycetota bacterium]